MTILLLSCSLYEQCPRPSRTPRAALLPRTIEIGHGVNSAWCACSVFLAAMGASGSQRLFLKVLRSLSKAALYISNVITSAIGISQHRITSSSFHISAKFEGNDPILISNNFVEQSLHVLPKTNGTAKIHEKKLWIPKTEFMRRNYSDLDRSW